jgi:hypothetical protein
MEQFTVHGENGSHITISFEEVYGFPESTCHWGGYDVRTGIKIKSGNFQVDSNLWTSTGEIHGLYESLKSCNADLKGTVTYISYEGNLELKIDYDNMGHAGVSGRFSEQSQLENELRFEFNSDQTYLNSTINELRVIVDKYGDMKGIKKIY